MILNENPPGDGVLQYIIDSCSHKHLFFFGFFNYQCCDIMDFVQHVFTDLKFRFTDQFYHDWFEVHQGDEFGMRVTDDGQ